ncbi:gliding motility lipoprotein GldH [Paludibacter sp.]
MVMLLGLVSCDKKTSFSQYHLVDPAGWSKDSLSIFDVDVEENTAYDLTINIRHTANYPYRNLWLFVDHITPDSIITSDTISCDLADLSGKWLGSGSASIYTLPVVWQQNYVFFTSGIHTFKIRQGMRDNKLLGIQAVGLKLDFHNGKE